MQCLAGACNRETTIYTLVGLFSAKASPKWSTTVSQLMKKEAYYISFRHFLNGFQKARWPTTHHEALAEIHGCKQKHDEDIATYADQFEELHQIVKWDIERSIDDWIAGLKEAYVKQQIGRIYFEDGDRTFKVIRDRSIHLQA